MLTGPVRVGVSFTWHQNPPKSLDPSYKMDLNHFDCFEGKKPNLELSKYGNMIPLLFFRLQPA